MFVKNMVSVLIPVYNVEDYVELAISSILNQTYQNIELIIVDDCSTDKTLEKVIKLSLIDSRIRIFKNSSNQKICKSLNLAFLHAKGEYILRMDGDDICSTDRIARKLDYLLSNNLDVVGCSTITIDVNDNEIGRAYALDDFNLILKTAKYRSPLQHIWLAKREVYDVLGGYRELPGAEDYDFILRAISFGFRVSNIRDYFGYSVRVGRVGNTVNTIGLRQLKLHDYVWHLFLERQQYRTDSYDPEKLEKSISTSPLFDSIFRQSSTFLNMAISDKRFMCKLFYIICAAQSPHQIKYLFNALMYRFITKFFGGSV